MRKFKHKQTGKIAVFDSPPCFLTVENEGYSIPKFLIENSNDWEEIKEEKQEKVPWLITAFKDVKSPNFIWELNKQGSYECSLDQDAGWFSLNEMLKGENTVQDGYSIIYKVKNSKGQEFTVGNKVRIENRESIIKEFVIFRDKYMYVLFNETDEHENINDLEKVKSADKPKLLFTTYDKVELFEEKQLFSVCIKANWEERRYSIKQAKQITDAWLHFNTKEAREEYIKQHKPKFSMADIEKVLNGLIITHKPINKESILSSLNNLKK